MPVGNHTVYVTDANGCEAAHLVTLEEDKEAPSFELDAVDYLTCTRETVEIHVIHTGSIADWESHGRLLMVIFLDQLCTHHRIS